MGAARPTRPAWGQAVVLVADPAQENLVLLGPLEQEVGHVGPGESDAAVGLDVVAGDLDRGLRGVAGGHGAARSRSGSSVSEAQAANWAPARAISSWWNMSTIRCLTTWKVATGRSNTTRTLAYSMASSSARSDTPTSSEARPTADIVETRRHSAVWSPDGPSGADLLLVEHQAGGLAGGVERRHGLAPRGARAKRADALLAAGDHDGPVGPCAVEHQRLVPAHDPVGPFATGPGAHRVRAGRRGPSRSGPRCPAGAVGQAGQQFVRPEGPGGQGGEHEEEKKGPGKGIRPICSKTMHVSSSGAPEPPGSSGMSRPVQPRSD